MGCRGDEYWSVGLELGRVLWGEVKWLHCHISSNLFRIRMLIC